MNSCLVPLNKNHSLTGKQWLGHELPIQDSLVVIREGSSKLYLLNGTAQLIWNEWRNDLQPETITEKLSSIFGISRKTLYQDILNALSSWEQAGLIGDKLNVEKEGYQQYQQTVLKQGAAKPKVWFEVKNYLFFDYVFRIRFASSEIMQAIHPLFSYLIAITPANHYHTALDIISTKHGFELQENGKIIFSNSLLNAIVMELLSYVMQQVYESRGSLLGMHAGAVAANGKCIVLPGASGSGKSTLTAALAYSGLTFLGDEVITIERSALNAVPLPLPLNLKKGSLAVLKSLFGDLKSCKKIKYEQRCIYYLQPPGYQNNSPSRHYPVSHFIFPHYQCGTEIKLLPLSSSTVLKRLINSYTVVTKPNDISEVTRLLEWIEEVPAFELQFDSLPDAVKKITDILEGAE